MSKCDKVKVLYKCYRGGVQWSITKDTETGATKVTMFGDTLEHTLPTLWVSYNLTYGDKKVCRPTLQGEETETGHEMSEAEAVQSE